MRWIHALVVFALVGLVSSCSSTRTTSTERTAIEAALLTETATEAVDSLEVPPMQSQSFKIDDSKLTAPEKEFVVSRLENKLLESGGRRAVGDSSDVLVEPVANYAHIDDGKFLIGIPAIPIPVPGVGMFNTPEIALFSREHQKGRAKVSAIATKNKDGSLVFSDTSDPSQRHYDRYKFLLFFEIRTTDLGKPF